MQTARVLCYEYEVRVFTTFFVVAVFALALTVPAARLLDGPKTIPTTARPAAPRTHPSSAPNHIETWAYDAGSGEGSTATPELVARYVTYAESAGDDKVLRDCHTVAPRCTALHYLNANRVYLDQDLTDILPVSRETWWMHAPGFSDNAHRLAAPLGKHVANILNQSDPGVRRFFQQYARTAYDAYDGLMLDDAAPGVAGTFYGSGYRSSQEIAGDEQVLAMHQALAKELTHRDGRPFVIVQNSVNPNPYLPHGLEMIGDPKNVAGLIAEGVPLSNGEVTKWYADLLDVVARVQQRPGFIVLLSYGSGGIPAERYLHTATIWLGYSRGHIVDWEDLGDNADLAVWPEETIYPMQPLQSMTKSNADLAVADHVWRREFASCYLKGTYWGRCAAVVNLSGVAVPVQSAQLMQKYTNMIQVVGGTVQDRNAAVTLGPLQSSIAANAALLLYGK